MYLWWNLKIIIQIYSIEQKRQQVKWMKSEFFICILPYVTEVPQSHKIMYVNNNIGLIPYISVFRCLDKKKTKYSELYGSKYSNTFTQSVSLKMYFNVWLPPLCKWTLKKLHQQTTGTLTWCLNSDLLRKVKVCDLMMLRIKTVI